MNFRTKCLSERRFFEYSEKSDVRNPQRIDTLSFSIKPQGILHYACFAFTKHASFRMTTLLTALIIAFFPSSSFAQPSEQECSILGITVEGNVSGNAETIISQSTLRKGDKIQLDAIRRGINRLWQQGIYADVNIEATKVIPQEGGLLGVYLTIKVKEFQHIDSVIIEGNKHIGTTDIEKSFTFYKNDFLRPWEIQNIKQKIRSVYTKEGYHYATITEEVQ